ncbi:hypothetical protein BY996DRAFT_6978442 [Phakopsora pachyrhizi]|nr:hypothetical protein BY996DRAFT_6978442 [Phakopsora pachyrhizi]
MNMRRTVTSFGLKSLTIFIGVWLQLSTFSIATICMSRKSSLNPKILASDCNMVLDLYKQSQFKSDETVTLQHSGKNKKTCFSCQLVFTTRLEGEFQPIFSKTEALEGIKSVLDTCGGGPGLFMITQVIPDNSNPILNITQPLVIQVRKGSGKDCKAKIKSKNSQSNEIDASLLESNNTGFILSNSGVSDETDKKDPRNPTRSFFVPIIRS